ncbi:MAG: threonine--tRNA ligase [Oligoflexales bacterium]
MSEVNIQLPDGSQRSFAAQQLYKDVAKSLSKSLFKTAIAVKHNDETLYDLSHPVQDGSIEFITAQDTDGLEVIRHTTAHILAMAVQKLWPGTQVTIGPVIEHGFYYDFAFPEGIKIGEKEFPAIEKEMKRIVKQNQPITREVIARDDAVEKFNALNEQYKVEIINSLPQDEEVSIYRMGEWFDLCRGPHLPSTGKAGAFHLTRIAGAYWRGDENNPMLTRIYGTAWANPDDLKNYLDRIEEAKKRDHRVLGKQLDLFSFHEQAPASPFFHPKGTFVYNRLVEYMRLSNSAWKFDEINTPLLMNVDLWHKSGHYENYRDNMYFTQVDDREAALKPMNCPGHCLVYGSRMRSYRELPLRLSEFGRVHRHEKSGVVHGLFRVRTFTQDDAHIFCEPEQIQDSIREVLDQIHKVYTDLGFPRFKVELSTRPEKSIGSDDVWEIAENALKTVLDSKELDYQVNPGDGAFYGPKIDFHLIDSLERSWQCGTVQLDFSMPKAFDLSYQNSQNDTSTPVMIHRAVLGSLERFLGIFIEHHAGHFPLWFSPVQARILSVRGAQEDRTRQIVADLKKHGIRAEEDCRNEKLGYKIRDAQVNKIPYMVVIGDQEMENGQLSPRDRHGKQHPAMDIQNFVDLVKSQSLTIDSES